MSNRKAQKVIGDAEVRMYNGMRLSNKPGVAVPPPPDKLEQYEKERRRTDAGHPRWHPYGQ